jgi:hypothetical protein
MMLERLVAMNADDPAFMLTVNQESSRTQIDEIRAELAALRAAVDDGANGLQGAREEAQTQLQQVVGAIEEANILNRPSGALAGLDEIERANVSTGYGLIEFEPNAPTPTRRRVVTDTSKSPNVVWVDDGTEVVRISRESQTNALASTQTITATGSNGRCVLKIKFESASQVNKIINTAMAVDFQTVAANADTVTGQWFVYLSPLDYALDAVVASAVTLWSGSGSGLSFVTDGGSGDVVLSASDHGGAVLNSGGDDVNDFVDTLGGADVYVYLALSLTAGGEVYLASLGTAMTMVLE